MKTKHPRNIPEKLLKAGYRPSLPPHEKIRILQGLGYNVTVHHTFKGGRGSQAMDDSVTGILEKSGYAFDIKGICEVWIEHEEFVAYGVAVSSEPYDKTRGLQIALGRAIANWDKETTECQPRIRVLESV